MSTRAVETCFDPRALTEPHACPGRCACYENHWCWTGSVCIHCREQHIYGPGLSARVADGDVRPSAYAHPLYIQEAT